MPPPRDLDAPVELLRLRYHARLSQRDIALATGVKPGVVTGWLKGTRRPRGGRADRLVALCACVEELSRYLPPSEVGAWLGQPLTPDARTALELIGAGHERHVSDEIRAVFDRPLT